MKIRHGLILFGGGGGQAPPKPPHQYASAITHEKCRLGRFRSGLKCYRLWIKWVLKFLILWSDEINHSNFENATKCLIKSWWYLLKHACFILKLKDFCNTCVHFQWKKTNSSRHIGILSALRMVCMTSASSWPNCVSRGARIKIHSSR